MPCCVVTNVSHGLGLTLAQCDVDSKTNEMIAIKDILKGLVLGISFRACGNKNGKLNSPGLGFFSLTYRKQSDIINMRNFSQY